MTRLRKMILEELERRTTPRVQHAPTFAASRISRGTSVVVLINWAPSTSANIRLNCLANGNWLPTQ